MFRGDDILKVYDDQFNYIAKATREEVHSKGLLHQVAHVWMLQEQGDDLYILIQQRSARRELFPGKYDLLQTTHFDPDESYEEGIVRSLDYYLGVKASTDEIIHLGSVRQRIDLEGYHDNALAQIFVIMVKKAIFFMPETEEILKVRYRDFSRFMHGELDKIDMFSLDDILLRQSTPEEWWLRKEEFFDVIEPYADAREGKSFSTSSEQFR